MVFDFLLTQEENAGGWRARERAGGWEGAWRHPESLPHTSSFPRYLVCFQAVESVTGSFLVSWLQPAPGRRQPGWILQPQASMTNRLGFPCHNIPLPNAKAFPFLLSHSPAHPPTTTTPFLPYFAMSSTLRGATVAVNSVTCTEGFSLSSNRFCSLCCFGIDVRMLIPKTANLTPGDTILPHTPKKQPPPRS